MVFERIVVARRYHRALSEARRLAYEDELTGLGNRRAMLAQVTKAIRQRRPVHLVLADLDGFKAVNDTYGHDVGDLVLRVVAARLTAEAGAGNFVARLGGDEFAVVTQGDDPALLPVLTDRLRVVLLRPIPVGGDQVTVGASIGTATRTPRDASPCDLFIRADAAMYRAKANHARPRPSAVPARGPSEPSLRRLGP
jgi:diguanylate cyclase (GGDEF)-like protein